MRFAAVSLLTFAALIAAQAACAAPGDSSQPAKPISLVPHAPAPGRVYGTPIQDPILHKRVRKKPASPHTPSS
ncbi:MAG TPA: hypothetical protein VK695_13120 [Steroidobacteraceae bacterium]|jgi:hypothetical protein|nr:hypothetical protein [Steroidobacteraceae bacterium]